MRGVALYLGLGLWLGLAQPSMAAPVSSEASSPQDEALTGDTPTGGNVFLVELRVNFGTRWYRLNSGPRPEDEARDLFLNLHRHLVPFRHIVTLYDMDRNTVVDEIVYEERDDNGSAAE